MMKTWLTALLMAFSGLLSATCGQAEPAVALFYGSNAPLDELKAFDIVVVDPDHDSDPAAFRRPYSELYAYIAIGEAHPTRGYFSDIPPAARLSMNQDWNSLIIDLAHPQWPDFVAERIVAPLWQKGYRGFFLDTLDSYRRSAKFDEQAQQAGLVATIETLHQRFPGIRLILNRGFEIVPRVRNEIQMVAAESLFRGWDAGNRRYVEVPEADREWLLDQLRTVRDVHGLPVLAIDYVAPHDRALTRATAERIRALGIIPWVTDAALETIGIGQREAMPRRIAVLYDGREGPSLNFTIPHRFLEMPLNHLGYTAEYFDINQELPRNLYGDRYAGAVTWLKSAPLRAREVSAWLLLQIERGLPLAMLDHFPLLTDSRTLRQAGLSAVPPPAAGQVRIARADPMFQGEAPLRADRAQVWPLRLDAGTPLIEVADSANATFAAAALTPWGGYITEPFVMSTVPGTEMMRWHVDPFAFLAAALRLPAMPVPDVTTENGRRLLLAHIDGDGFPSRAEYPGSPLAAQVLYDEILTRFRIPHSVSVIEAEVAPHGLHPQDSAEMEAIARRIYALPHVEVASHSFSHPFRWDSTVRHGVFRDAEADQEYHLSVPGYTFDIRREIVGSLAYLRQRLAPRDKPVRLFFWTGDTAPGEEALRVAHEAQVLGINGGNTFINRSNPSLSAVTSIGIRKGRFFQVYAPVTNENIYTNLWRGPFYGYRRVIETFEMTESPRRLKPIGIYYHVYSGTKKAALSALTEVYRWALDQHPHPVHASEYVLKADEFARLAIARESGGWRIRGEGNLRTVRVPRELGYPDIAASRKVAGYKDASDGRYVHLAADDALLRLTTAEKPQTRLLDANARLTDWQAGNGHPRFRLQGHQPLEFALAGNAGCQVRADGKPVAPERVNKDSVHFRLSYASAKIETRCDGN